MQTCFCLLALSRKVIWSEVFLIRASSEKTVYLGTYWLILLV